MAFYPDVTPGEEFKPIASLENELRRIVNSQDGFRSSLVTGSQLQSLSVPVYNCGPDILYANTAVSFVQEQQKYTLDDVPAAPVKKYKTGNRWGVLTSAISPGEFGSCIISGIALVSSKGGGGGEMLSPSSDGSYFESGSEVQSIYSSSGKALVLLGGGGGLSTSYNGYFSLKISYSKSGKPDKIIVCDGQTYDRDNSKSGKSLSEVNGFSFWLDYKEFDIPDKKSIIYLLFTPFIDEGKDVADELKKDKVEIKMGVETDLNQKGKATYLIGDISIVDNKIVVCQRHGNVVADNSNMYSSFNEAARFNYYYECNE